MRRELNIDGRKYRISIGAGKVLKMANLSMECIPPDVLQKAIKKARKIKDKRGGIAKDEIDTFLIDELSKTDLTKSQTGDIQIKMVCLTTEMLNGGGEWEPLTEEYINNDMDNITDFKQIYEEIEAIQFELNTINSQKKKTKNHQPQPKRKKKRA